MENKTIRIALAGNPNCGKTTLFNALTGSNQFVGNWPGVTVEKKEGKLKKHDDVIITDLPGIYSLSPYTLEEVVARNYLIGERPDAILNIIDGTNLERNLYLTTQLTELGIPVVVAINMMDLVKKAGDKINVAELSRQLGCQVVEISALKGTGIQEAAEAAIKASSGPKTVPMHTFSGPVEHAIAHIEEAVLHNMPEEQQRWYAIKIFERDDKVLAQMNIPQDTLAHIETDIQAAEKESDDDAESIITGERYVYIADIIKSCYRKKSAGALTTSDKIDKIVTNRWLGLPIFAVVMFLVYYIAMIAVGTPATDWANDGLFGDGYHLFGIGTSAYEEAADEYGDTNEIISALVAEYGDETLEAALDSESEDYDEAAAAEAIATLRAAVPAGLVLRRSEDLRTGRDLRRAGLLVHGRAPARARVPVLRRRAGREEGRGRREGACGVQGVLGEDGACPPRGETDGFARDLQGRGSRRRAAPPAAPPRGIRREQPRRRPTGPRKGPGRLRALRTRPQDHRLRQHLRALQRVRDGARGRPRRRRAQGRDREAQR